MKKQIYKNNYQMPKKHEFCDNVAAQISSVSTGEV